MRIKHFFGLAVLAAMTASCSSNNDLVVGGVMALVRMRLVQAMHLSLSTCLQQVVLVQMILSQVHHHLRMVTRMSMLLRMQLFFSSRKMLLLMPLNTRKL